MTTAFDPIEVAGVPLANRIVMSPMTRSRAYGHGASPTSLMPRITANAPAPG